MTYGWKWAWKCYLYMKPLPDFSRDNDNSCLICTAQNNNAAAALFYLDFRPLGATSKAHLGLFFERLGSRKTSNWPENKYRVTRYLNWNSSFKWPNFLEKWTDFHIEMVKFHVKKRQISSKNRPKPKSNLVTLLSSCRKKLLSIECWGCNWTQA